MVKAHAKNELICVMNYRIRRKPKKENIDSPIIKMAEHSILFSSCFQDPFSFYSFVLETIIHTCFNTVIVSLMLGTAVLIYL